MRKPGKTDSYRNYVAKLKHYLHKTVYVCGVQSNAPT